MSQTQTATFTYLKATEVPKEEKPFQIFHPVSAEDADPRLTNIEWEDGPEETVHNIRGQQDTLSIDRQGFKIIRYPTAVQDFSDDEVIKTKYLPELKTLLQSEFKDADRIVFFNWATRRAKREAGRFNPISLPSKHPHIDQSPGSVRNQIRRQFPGEAEELLKSRIRVINIWRPTFNSTVCDYPLALCDSQTLQKDKLVEVNNIYGQANRQMLYTTYQPDRKWYYLDQQSRDEVTMFKIYDSATDDEVAPTLHTSFRCVDIPEEGVPPRESVEVRALIFTKEKVG